MYTIKIHNVHNQNTSSASYSMHVFRITEVGDSIFIQYIDNILGKMLKGLKKCGKIGLRPGAYPSRTQTLKIHIKTCPCLSVYSKCGKEKVKEKKKDWKGLDSFGWTQLKWLHGCIFRWQISVFALGSSC